MDRKEFSEYLRDFLSAYDDDAVEEVIKFYDEIICDKIEEGMTEGDAIDSLGDREIFLKKITEQLDDENKKSDSEKKKNKNRSRHIKECDRKISRVEIETVFDKVQVETYAGEFVKIEFYDYEKRMYDYTVCGEEVSLKKIKGSLNDVGDFFTRIFKSENYPVIISLPADFNGALCIKSSSGSVNITSVKPEKLRISTSSGRETNLVNVTAAHAVIDSGMNSLSFSGCSFGEMDITSSTGGIDLNVTECGTVKIKNTMGICEGILKNTENCDIRGVSGELEIIPSGEMDDYTINSKSLGKLSVINKDKNIITCSGGLDFGSGEKKLSVKYISGNIKFIFV